MRWQKEIKRVCSRAIIAYGVVAVILFFLGDYKKACVVRLNTIATWGDYPMDLAKNKGVYDKRRLYMAIRYYKILQDLYPQSDQPSAMIGYSYSLLHENQLSMKYFKMAKMRAMSHFWHDYNLGQLYYRSGKKAVALLEFQKIVNADFDMLKRSAIIAPLNSMELQERQRLYQFAADFASNVRSLSLNMIIKINFENRDYVQAATTAILALKDNAVNNKSLYMVYLAAAMYGSKDFEKSVLFSKLILEQQPNMVWAKMILLNSVKCLENKDFKEADQFWENFLNDKGLFSAELGNPILHSWAYFIQPGKEMYY